MGENNINIASAATAADADASPAKKEEANVGAQEPTPPTAGPFSTHPMMMKKEENDRFEETENERVAERG